MARRPASAADFDVVRGNVNDVKAFRRFVDQKGGAALANIEDAIARGAPRVNKAAWLCLAELDLAGAETRALAAAGGAEAIRTKKELVEPLIFVATAACLDRHEALGVEVDPEALPDQSFTRAQGWAMARLLRCEDQHGQESILQEWFPKYRLVPGTLAVLRGGLDQAALHARRRLFQILIEARDLESCRRDDLPAEFTIEARFVLPPAEAFQRLRPFFEANPDQHGAIIRALARQKACDPGWVEMFASIGEPLRTSGLLATRRAEALTLLAPLIRNMGPGPELLAVLTELRGFDAPEAAELLLPWLERSELDGNAALLATSMRACGTPAHEAALQAAAQRNPAGAMFYLEAVSHIQARHRLSS